MFFSSSCGLRGWWTASYRRFWTEDRRLPLEAFIAKKTDGRLVRVQGTDWRVSYDAAGEATAGRGALPGIVSAAP